MAGIFGPRLDRTGCTFRLWARPDAKIDLVIEKKLKPCTIPMKRQPNGMFEVRAEGAGAGTLYWFRMNGEGPFPDPASRYQPQGVHGPSQVLESNCSTWNSPAIRARDLVFYELHVGTFSPAGTFLGAVEKLDFIDELGVNAIELMPIAEFAGERNWGYDGVSLYAPSHNYGTPDDLRRLVEAAHQRGLAVFLDVVYNHLGPDGAYHSMFAPRFYSGRHHTPWGDGLNFDGEEREKVRAYFIESALNWILEYGIDGLRVDATQTILDDSEPHFLAELAEKVHVAGQELGRAVLIIAEDARNERKVILPLSLGGYGFDGVWADDFHHNLRRRMAGDSDGYFCDYDGSTESIASTLQNGWLFSGQYSGHQGESRGTSADGLTWESRVFCIQNHDQIGNRAFGERLSTEISRAAYFAASALLLLAPEVPLLFMGQEWAAAEPFLFFTDHNADLGRLVTEGRRKEFASFTSFSDETRRENIPNPQARETFLASKLNWDAVRQPEHAACLHWYQRLLQIRKLLLSKGKFKRAWAANDEIIVLQWVSGQGEFRAVIALEAPARFQDPAMAEMHPVACSEDFGFTKDAPHISWDKGEGCVTFEKPGALLVASGHLHTPEESGRR